MLYLNCQLLMTIPAVYSYHEQDPSWIANTLCWYNNTRKAVARLWLQADSCNYSIECTSTELGRDAGGRRRGASARAQRTRPACDRLTATTTVTTRILYPTTTLSDNTILTFTHTWMNTKFT